jgi:DNA polymerase-1
MVASGVPEALWERTPTGALSTAADSLEVWAGFDGALRTWHEYGHTQKMLSTYIEALEAAGDDPIHPFVDTLRETGRVSMRAPNLQNLPRKGALRECFTPRPGRVYVSADYDTAELRALAQTCLDVLGWSRLAETYQADPAADPHLHFAASMLGIAYGDAKVRYHEGDVAVVGARQRAKAANFGFPGGMGAAKFVLAQRKQGAAFTVDEAFALRNAWFSQWPEIPEYFKWVNDQGDVFTTRRSQRTRGGCGFCDGANNGFQAVIADVAKTAAWYAERAGLYVVNFLHDELIIECAEQEVGRCARVLVDCMVTAGAEFLPDVPVRAEAKAMRRWSKAAKRATNDRGELVAWG